MINSRGLLFNGMSSLKDFQQTLCQPNDILQQWDITTETATLEQTVARSKSTILVGVSAVANLFTQDIIQQMRANTEKPIILPLSNPTSKIEAQPIDILKWTDGSAIIATGSPFEPIHFNGRTHPIAQCNNSYIFPGIGLGVISSKASRVTDNMLMASSYALAEYASLHSQTEGLLLPDLNKIRDVSRFIAIAVYHQAIKDGVAQTANNETIEKHIDANFWAPEYRSYKRTAV